MDNEIRHIGTKYSGRYPKGSGDDSNQRNRTFLDLVDNLKGKGLSRVEIAKGCGMNTAELKDRVSIAKMEIKKADYALASTLRSKGIGDTEIGRQMLTSTGRVWPESSIRSLLNEEHKTNNEKTDNVVNALKDAVKKHELIDVGLNSEIYLGITRTRMKTALTKLKDEGYLNREIYVDQLGTGGNKKTTIKVLSPPGDKYKEIKSLYENQANIKMVVDRHFEEDGKKSYGLEPPTTVALSRVGIRYAEQGGTAKDGVIELRRGTEDLSLGPSSYAQVRISVNGTHYLKGMAVYSDDLPKGIDILFNSNKSEAKGKFGSMKELKTVSKTDKTIDPDNPFGSQIKQANEEKIKAGGQSHYIDSKGVDRLSAINKVNEEGDWEKWSKNLSSQMLSKQLPSLAAKQLGITYAIKKEEYDDIVSLNNPAVKKRLLESFADDCDSSSVHMKAAALPRQGSHVILPIEDMKDTEIYAPNFHNGEPVVLIRYPHGGTFEIPSLIVNNNQPTAKRRMGPAKDAIGISPKVAERLSGADFDGDSVLVIPNKNGNTIQTKPALKDLKDFDPKTLYKKYPGMPLMTSHDKQMEMGKASNLITDMTIRGASPDELCRAVKHSMVVIDAEKHELDYKKSFEDNQIAALKKRYQGATNGGASTLLSRASSEADVNKRKEKSVYKTLSSNTMTPAELVKYNKGIKTLNMTPQELVDHNNGKKVYEYSGEHYFKPLTTKINGVVTKVEKKVSDMTPEELTKHNAGKKVYELSTVPTYKTIMSTKMAETQDAFTLTSGPAGTLGTPMEVVYATHANKLKALANDARKLNLVTPHIVYSNTAAKVYATEVASLNAQLKVALSNSPLERQAMLMASAILKAKKAANPDMDKETIKKIQGQELTTARNRMGAKKERVVISPKEWEAIQAGAVSDTVVNKILTNTNLDVIKQLAMPRTNNVTGLSSTKEARIRAMLKSGNNQRDIADALGVSLADVKLLM